MTHPSLTGPAALPFMAVAGCTSSTDSLPRAALSEKTTVDGKPLASGTISMNAANQGMGREIVIARAVNAHSVYEITRPGASPGKYRVAILAPGIGEDVPTWRRNTGTSPKMKPGQKEKIQIPARYDSNTDNTWEVKAGFEHL